MIGRLALGLADPVVVNRFLLRKLGALCATLIVLAGGVIIAVPPAHSLVQISMMSVGLLGSAASVFYFFAFFPP